MLIQEIKPNGFCGGVKRALRIVNENLDNGNFYRDGEFIGFSDYDTLMMNRYNLYTEANDNSWVELGSSSSYIANEKFHIKNIPCIIKDGKIYSESNANTPL